MEVITIVDSDDDDDGTTASAAARGNTTRSVALRSVVINTRSSDETNNDDGSTSSSDDSIWKIKGLSITGHKSNDAAAKNIDDATFVDLFKDSCLITPTEAASSSTQESQSRRYNPFKDDASSSNSLVEFDNAAFHEDISSVDTAPLHSSSHASLLSCRKIEEGNDCLVTTTVVQSFEDDSSSVSSEDSIWNKVGLRLPPSKSNNGVAGVTNLPGNLTPSKTTVSLTRACHDITNDDFVDTEDDAVTTLPHYIPLLPAVDGKWRVILLMDHREFGCANNFLTTVEKKINKHFREGTTYCEITTLPSADYLFVARLLSNTTGEIMDERILDMIIERKSVQDVCQCLIADSKSECVWIMCPSHFSFSAKLSKHDVSTQEYKPLSFFEAQMYKLQHCGMSNKLFLMEGDEDRTKNLFAGAKSNMEKERRLKRIKTLRLQLANGEFEGVDLICTRNRHDTVLFLIQKLEKFHLSFNPQHPPTKTMEELKLHINEEMKTPTFLEYLRLRSQPGIGDVKAMKVIMDPTLDWDKSFLSPCSNKTSKASLNDRATFWSPISVEIKDQTCLNPYRCTSKQPMWNGDLQKKMGSKKNYERGIKTVNQFSTKCIEQGVLLDEVGIHRCVATTDVTTSDTPKGDLADSSKSLAHVIVLDSDNE